MGAFFFDSSALVKLHVNETGMAWVKSIADPAAANRIYILRIAGVEVVSAITRRKQGGALDTNDAATALADFHRDFAREHIIIEVDATLIARHVAVRSSCSTWLRRGAVGRRVRGSSSEACGWIDDADAHLRRCCAQHGSNS